jgi:DNA-binding CsgD family transcriptional regulator/PAS domain-containing protein
MGMGSRSALSPTSACAGGPPVSDVLGPAIHGRRRATAATREIQQLIARIYDAALDSALWPSCLGALSDAIGGSSAVFFDQDVEQRRVGFIFAHRVDTGQLDTYSAYFAAKDIWIRGAFRLTAGAIAASAALVPSEDFIKSEFYNDFLKHLDIFHLVCAVVENRPRRCAVASIFRPNRAEDFGPDEHKLSRILCPHLQRAAEIHRRFAGLQASSDAVREVWDRLPRGIIVLDSHARVLAMNRRAHSIVAQRDGLGIAPGGLEAATPRQTRQLRALIGEAAKTSAGEGLGAGGAMVLARPSQQRPLEVLVTPLRLAEHVWGVEAPAVAVFVSDPEQQPELTSDVLRRHHGLTLAEARLAAALAGGVSLRDFADQAEITMNTARWTLKQVFAKTETSRQAELVRLLLSGLAGLNIEASG